MVVLEPVDAAGATEVPRTWGTVYDASLLLRTAHLLQSQAQAGIAVPGDVQRLVDAVYAQDFVDGLDVAAAREVRRMDAERTAGEMAEGHLAAMVGICAPADVAGDLSKLSRREPGVTEELLTTRLGADSGRILCLYQHGDGKLSLDQAGHTALPRAGRGGVTRGQLATVMAHVAPVPGRWLRTSASTEEFVPPRQWGTKPMLGGLVVLPMTASGEGTWVCGFDGKTISMSEVGLEIN